MEKTELYLTEAEYRKITEAQKKAEAYCADEVAVRYAWEIARILTMWKIPADVIIASYLFPLVQYTIFTGDLLEKEFGRRPVEIAYSLKMFIQDTQNTQLILEDDDPTPQRTIYTEHLRSLFMLAYTDIEKVLLIVAYRLITAQEVEKMEQAEAAAWGQENIAVYLPLLELFGLWEYRSDLGNLSLIVSNPQFYSQLDHQIQLSYEQQILLYHQIAGKLNPAFDKHGLQNTLVQLHDITPISMSQRMERARRRGRKFNPDKAGIMTVDVIMDSVKDCYHALGIIHNFWKPAHRHRESDNGRFIDYIATPRYNAYRCLITTVMVEDTTGQSKHPLSKLVEFRIRTQVMEQMNTLGIIAAVQLKEVVKNAWWEDNRARQYVRTDTPESTRGRKEIAVFTPTGEIMYAFEKGSTGIDVAFRIHANLGPYTRRIFINGRAVPFKQPIAHLDLVEIDFDTQYATIEPEWEEYAKTIIARRNIRQFIRAKSLSPDKGRRILEEVLEREMNIYQMRFPQEKIDDLLLEIGKRYGCSTLDALYLKVLKNEIAPDEVVSSMIESELIGYIVMGDNNRLPFTEIKIARTWFQEKGAKKWDRSSRVMPGVKIVGALRGRGNHTKLIIHRADSRFAPTGKDAVNLNWVATTTPREIAEITVTAPPQSHVLGMVANTLVKIGGENEAEKIILPKMVSEIKDGSLNIEVLIDAPSITHLNEARNSLAAMERNGFINGFKIWQLFPGKKLQLALRSDKRTQNPFTLRHVRDPSMFFGRDSEINRIVDFIQNDQTFIILYGQQRIGKTSLLFRLAEQIIPEKCNVLPVQFDAHSVYSFSTPAFLKGLINATERKIGQRFKRIEDRQALQIRQREFESDPFYTFESWVRRVEERLQGTRLFFLIDEFTRAEEEAKNGNITMEFFHGLQYLAGNANIGFLLCLHDHIYKESSAGWGTYQRGQPVRLLHLERGSAEQLIRNPLGRFYTFDDVLVDRILDLTHCHPYFIQIICHELTTHMAQTDRLFISQEDLDQVVSRLIPLAHHYFRHYENQVGNTAWEILRAIAFRGTDEDHWVTSEDIRDMIQRLNMKFESWQIAKSIGDLKQAGLIEAREHHGQTLYTIPVGVLRLWMHARVTDELVSQNIPYKG